MSELRVGVERDGGNLVISVRERGGAQFTMTAAARAGAALSATLVAALASEEAEFSTEFQIHGDLQVKEPTS